MKKILQSLIGLTLSTIFFTAAHAATNDADRLVNGLNEFAFNLFQQVQSEDQNVVLSPYSLSTLLTILATGAEGKTHRQFKTVLHLNGLKEDRIPVLLDKISQVDSAPSSKQLFLNANALWADKTFSYKTTFLDHLKQNKSIHFKTLDFMHHAETARQAINQWVESKTNHLIKQLLPEGSVTSVTQLILTNAIYFKGRWQLPFKSANTELKPFKLLNGNEVQVPMMHQEDKFFYIENNMLQLLQLKYSHSSLAMAILLPKPNYNLTAIRRILNEKVFLELLKNSSEQSVNVFLPKFKVESTFNQLKKNMKTLGLKEAFTDHANFSKMTSQPIAISDMIQKAVIQVDEEGTVAAAATAVMVIMTAYVEPLRFEANRPFIFIIFDTKSKNIFFIGQIIDPKTFRPSSI